MSLISLNDVQNTASNFGTNAGQMDSVSQLVQGPPFPPCLPPWRLVGTPQRLRGCPAQAQPRPGRIQITGRRWSDVALRCAHYHTDGCKRTQASKQASQAREQLLLFQFRASCPRPRRALRGPADDDDRSRKMTRPKKCQTNAPSDCGFQK
jgi:hypothetical protein